MIVYCYKHDHVLECQSPGGFCGRCLHILLLRFLAHYAEYALIIYAECRVVGSYECRAKTYVVLVLYMIIMDCWYKLFFFTGIQE